MNALGIDVGLRNVGWGIVTTDDEKLDAAYVASGVITTPKKAPYAASLRIIRMELEAVMRSWQIDQIGIEDIHPIKRSLASLKGTNYVIGVIHELTAYMGYPEPYLISPSRMKKYLTGSGKADKKAVMEHVVNALRLTGVVLKGKAKPGVVKAGHETDALAIALTTISEVFDEVD